MAAFSGFDRQAHKWLEILGAATSLGDLRGLPSNRLEALRGNRAGQYSIRINDQWRVCFDWAAGRGRAVECRDCRLPLMEEAP